MNVSCCNIRAAKDEDAIREIISFFREVLAEKSSDLQYQIEASVGYEFLGSAEDTAEACMKRADKKLYRDKRRT